MAFQHYKRRFEGARLLVEKLVKRPVTNPVNVSNILNQGNKERGKREQTKANIIQHTFELCH